jgi:hypothetical protein
MGPRRRSSKGTPRQTWAQPSQAAQEDLTMAALHGTGLERYDPRSHRCMYYDMYP